MQELTQCLSPVQGAAGVEPGGAASATRKRPASEALEVPCTQLQLLWLCPAHCTLKLPVRQAHTSASLLGMSMHPGTCQPSARSCHGLHLRAGAEESISQAPGAEQPRPKMRKLASAGLGHQRTRLSAEQQPDGYAPRLLPCCGPSSAAPHWHCSVRSRCMGSTWGSTTSHASMLGPALPCDSRFTVWLTDCSRLCGSESRSGSDEASLLAVHSRKGRGSFELVVLQGQTCAGHWPRCTAAAGRQGLAPAAPACLTHGGQARCAPALISTMRDAHCSIHVPRAYAVWSQAGQWLRKRRAELQ